MCRERTIYQKKRLGVNQQVLIFFVDTLSPVLVWPEIFINIVSDDFLCGSSIPCNDLDVILSQQHRPKLF